MRDKSVSRSAHVRGVLYVVATPIGHLDDLSPRARAVLAQVQLIAAEDTRHTAKLLAAIGVHTPLLSLHEHNEAARVALIQKVLDQGQSVALVADAGTPLISDPGFVLVRELTTAGVRVVPVPGACAAIAALSVAGLPTDRFVFEGFLAAKAARRRAQLQALYYENRTLVFYEAPHRCLATLTDMAAVLGARPAVVCRELTKMYETCYYGTLIELSERAAVEPDFCRGEQVLVVAGNDSERPKSTELSAEHILKVLLEELPVAQAAKLAASLSGMSRAALYDLAVSWKRDD